MKHIWHYLKDFDISNLSATTKHGNRECTDLPLMVNCAGKINQLGSSVNSNPQGRLDFYLMYIISGEAKIYNGSETTIAKEGSVIVFPPNKGYKHSSSDAVPISYLWVHFTGSEAQSILKRYGIKMYPTINKARGENRISNRFQKLFDGFAKNDSFKTYDLSALLDRLLIEVGRAISVRRGETIIFSKSIRHINENYASPIRITELAKMENVSMTTYNLHFKEQTGASPTKYILSLRMHSAKELLESSMLSIKEISSMCGYEDFNFFTKAFKKFVGVSPMKYRKSSK